VSWFHEDPSIRSTNKEAYRYSTDTLDGDIVKMQAWMQNNNLTTFSLGDLQSLASYKTKFWNENNDSSYFTRLLKHELLCKKLEDDFYVRANRENKAVTIVRIGGKHQRIVHIFRNNGYIVTEYGVYSDISGASKSAFLALMSYFLLTDEEYRNAK
jgi:hypothetical protein